jgi:signal recognition particle GTPase
MPLAAMRMGQALALVRGESNGNDSAAAEAAAAAQTIDMLFDTAGQMHCEQALLDAGR